RVARAIEAQGIVLRASSLSYNLFTLRVALDDLVVAARETPDRPFFAADAVNADVPWQTILGGPIAVQSVEITNPRVTVERDASGRLNLPTFEENEDSEPIGPVTVGHVAIRGLDASYADAEGDIDVEMDGFTLALEPEISPGAGRAAGTFAADEGVRIRVGEKATTIDSLAGRLAFDGTSLFLDDVAVVAPEGTVELAGRLGVLLEEPDI